MDDMQPTPPPSSPRRNTGLWLVGGALLAAAGVVGYFMFFGGDEGVVEFKLSDPKIAARFQIDGKDVMPDADNAVRLPSGIHDLLVTAENYQEEKKPFHVKRGGREILKIELRPKPKPPEVVVIIDPAELKRKQAEAAKLVDEAAKLLDDNKPKDAVPVLDKALELDAKSARGYALRGRAYLLLDELGKANEDATSSSKLASDNAELLLLKSMQSRQFPKTANDFAGRALQQDPKLVLAHALMGEALIREGKLAEGIAACDRALKKNERILLAWRNRALAYGCLGQWDKALVDLDALNKRDEADAYAHWAKALVLARLDKLDQARHARTQALKLDLKVVQPLRPVFNLLNASMKLELVQAEEWADKARTAFDQGNLDKTVECADAALKLNPLCATALAYRGAARFLYEEKEKAKDDCDQAIKLDSGQGRAYLTRALMADDKDADKIIADATVVITLGNKSQGHTRRALGYLRRHDYEQAVADGQAALKQAQLDKVPVDPKTYHHLGEAYAYLGQFDQALANFDQFVKAQPKDPQGYWYRAGVFLKKEDRNKAEADLKKVKDLDDELGEPPVFGDPQKDQLNLPAAKFVERAQAHAKAGKRDNAIGDWTIALRLEPKWFAERGLAFLARGDFDQARDDFTQAINQDPKNPTLYGHRAEAHTRMGMAMEAVNDLNQALALDGKNAAYLWQRAALYQRLGNLLQTADDREAAMQLDPSLAKAPPPTIPDPPFRLLPRQYVFIPWGGR